MNIYKDNKAVIVNKEIIASRNLIRRTFVHSQIDQLKVGGWPLFFSKLSYVIKVSARRFGRFIGIIITAPLILLIVAIRPFFWLRFGTMMNHRIGHFGADTEAYLCSLDREKLSHRKIDIIGCFAPVCNRQLKVMWQRHLRIIPGAWLWATLDLSCQFWTHGDSHHIKLYDRSSEYRLFLNTEPHLFFTDDEHLKGQELLKKLGIPAEANWVCIHNRDSAYLDKTFGSGYNYHNYRDFTVETMLTAVDELIRRGYYVIRVGSIVQEALTSSNQKIIDYANSHFRSDFGDIYLLAHGSFFLGNDSGIWALPLIFRKPIAMVNFTLLSNFIKKDYKPWFFILKHFWHKKQKRFLTLREMLETGLAGADQSFKFEEAGVELICNTPEEIRDLAIEVDERLKGQWQQLPEDEKLQQQFWDIFLQNVPKDYKGNTFVRIGAAFLREHQDLLN